MTRLNEAVVEEAALAWLESAGWECLRNDLLTMAALAEVYALFPTEYGEKYLARGIMKAPNGQSTELVSVWIVHAVADEDLLAVRQVRRSA